MAKTVAIGIQDFEKIIERNCFYIDKTMFIKEWWESGDDTTLITRPRRFGKTFNMSMLETFFSVDYADRGDLFDGLAIWEEEKYRQLQGTYPVISLSFASVKEKGYKATTDKICEIIQNIYAKYEMIRESNALGVVDKIFFDKIIQGTFSVTEMTSSIMMLSKFLYSYYGKKAIILLDEYDTPMQEAYVNGYWDDLVAFTRSLFNSTFKSNTFLERAIMTGITRVSKQSIFSDLNHLEVITTTSEKYATSFGFTQNEVFAALDEYGLTDKKEEVKYWYDGFIFGKHADIYNPWSIINYLDKSVFSVYWANTSSNSLVGKLIREGTKRVKLSFEALLRGETIICSIDEQIVYDQLKGNEAAIWSLLVASGYLKVLSAEKLDEIEMGASPKYELDITNQEVRYMFNNMVKGWFDNVEQEYGDFLEALIIGDIDAMNEYMNEVSLQMFSYFDTGARSSKIQPEKFYHGFVLGLLVELRGRFIVTSNRESGFGRYDITLEPADVNRDDAIIIEFKVFNPRKEKTIEETLESALLQIEEKKYEEDLIARGFSKEKIRKYGFAFEGKKVLIG